MGMSESDVGAITDAATTLSTNVGSAIGNNIGRQWQERMRGTAHQAEVADLKAAGLNPILSATGGSGASMPSSPAQGQLRTTNLGSAFAQSMATKSQIDVNNASIKKILADEAQSKASADSIRKDIEIKSYKAGKDAIKDGVWQLIPTDTIKKGIQNIQKAANNVITNSAVSAVDLERNIPQIKNKIEATGQDLVNQFKQWLIDLHKRGLSTSDVIQMPDTTK